jgi:WD40 repeat protein
MTLDGPDDVITSVQWSNRDSILSVGTNRNAVQLWDVSKSTCVRQMGGHTSRVSALSWNDNILSSGGRDSVILNHDVRARNHLQFKYVGHQQEVCGLKWSPDGTTLASGG